MIDVRQWVRPHLRDIEPYSSARDEFSGEAEIFLDANENSIGGAAGENWNRYPDPYQKKLTSKIAQIKGISPDRIFLGNGSDEPIDLLIRLFCEPGEDRVLTFPPTYSMYRISARIHGVDVDEVMLTENFQLDVPAFDKACKGHKIVFLCSPNNPSGNVLKREDILHVITSTRGIVVLDEAYIDFISDQSLINRLSEFPNLVILQTFSKAWGLAGFRLGTAYADPKIVDYLNRIKPPYNLSGPIQHQALEALEKEDMVKAWVSVLVREREKLELSLQQFGFIEKIFPGDANFLLVRCKDAGHLYGFLKSHNIVVRDRSRMPLCENCLRITVGTEVENQQLISTLKKYKN